MWIGITMDLRTAEHQHHNASSRRTDDDSRPFHWTKDPDPIIAAVTQGHHSVGSCQPGICAEFITETEVAVREFMPRHDVHFAPLRNDRYTDVGTLTPTAD